MDGELILWFYCISFWIWYVNKNRNYKWNYPVRYIYIHLKCEFIFFDIIIIIDWNKYPLFLLRKQKRVQTLVSMIRHINIWCDISICPWWMCMPAWTPFVIGSRMHCNEGCGRSGRGVGRWWNTYIKQVYSNPGEDNPETRSRRSWPCKPHQSSS